MIKTYEIRNTVSAVFIFRLGKAQPFKAEFKGGRLDLEKPVAATFSTPHLGQQLAIEKDPRFGKLIFLKGSRQTAAQSPAKKDAGATTVPSAPEMGPNAETVEVPEVTTLGDAVNYLKTKHAAKATQMRDFSSVMAMAERCNVKFPNLKEEK